MHSYFDGSTIHNTTYGTRPGSPPGSSRATHTRRTSQVGSPSDSAIPPATPAIRRRRRERWSPRQRAMALVHAGPMPSCSDSESFAERTPSRRKSTSPSSSAWRAARQAPSSNRRLSSSVPSVGCRSNSDGNQTVAVLVNGLPRKAHTRADSTGARRLPEADSGHHRRSRRPARAALLCSWEPPLITPTRVALDPFRARMLLHPSRRGNNQHVERGTQRRGPASDDYCPPERSGNTIVGGADPITSIGVLRDLPEAQ